MRGRAALAHGAISTAHVLLTDDGRVMLTDCVFGSGIELLQRNRERCGRSSGSHWRLPQA
jgi:hypothetical protein